MCIRDRWAWGHPQSFSLFSCGTFGGESGRLGTNLVTCRDRLRGLGARTGRRHEDRRAVVAQLCDALADVRKSAMATDLLGGAVVRAGEPAMGQLLDLSLIHI